MIGLQFLSAGSCAQRKQRKPISDLIAHDKKLIIGKWKAGNDPNIIIVFTSDSCYEFYGKDTTGISYYVIADTCYRRDSEITQSDETFTYLSERYYFYKQYNHEFLFCYPIMGLSHSSLTLMNSDGSIGIFHRIK